MSLMLPAGVVQQQGGGVVYDPGMMTFTNTSAFYSKTSITFDVNAFTLAFRHNSATFTGGAFINPIIFDHTGSLNIAILYVFSSDYATADERNKVVVQIFNSANAVIGQLKSKSDYCSGADTTFFLSYNGADGAYVFKSDLQADEDDATYGARVIPSAATLYSGSNCQFLNMGKLGSMGPFTFDKSVIPYTTLFSGLTPINISGTGYLFYNENAKLDANVGTAGNATANGTITCPA